MKRTARFASVFLFLGLANGCSDTGPRNENFQRIPDPVTVGNDPEPASRDNSAATASAAGNMASVAPPLRGPQAPADAWLVGNWTGPGGSCLHATVYQGDGTWRVNSESGTWSLSGADLTHVLLETAGEGGDDLAPPVRVRNPRPASSVITQRDASSFTQRSADGRTWVMTRCPANP